MLNSCQSAETELKGSNLNVQIFLDFNWLTVFETFSHVFRSRNTALLVKAAQIWRTPLKLWRHREMSATAAHFSIAATLADRLLLRTISDTTSWETSLNRRVISRMLGARFALSDFIQAWPKNSLENNCRITHIECHDDSSWAMSLYVIISISISRYKYNSSIYGLQCTCQLPLSYKGLCREFFG